jgi:hypothetical protein
MKVGDLVVMPGPQGDGHWLHPCSGIVVELSFVGDEGQRQQTPRVGVAWADGNRIDWEPESWLEVISESR